MGQAIKETRKTLCIGQAEFARRIGVNRSTMCRWESGELIPSTEHFVKINDYYKASCNGYLGDELKKDWQKKGM